MNTLVKGVSAIHAKVTDTRLIVTLSDGREVGVPLSLPWLEWLANASPEQKDKWTLEPDGFAIYWDDLDDGVEIAHLLSLQPMS